VLLKRTEGFANTVEFSFVYSTAPLLDSLQKRGATYVLRSLQIVKTINGQSHSLEVPLPASLVFFIHGGHVVRAIHVSERTQHLVDLPIHEIDRSLAANVCQASA